MKKDERLPIDPKPQDTVFMMNDKNNSEILKLCESGEIYVHGRLAENDKEVVDALKEFLRSQGFIR